MGAPEQARVGGGGCLKLVLQFIHSSLRPGSDADHIVPALARLARSPSELNLICRSALWSLALDCRRSHRVVLDRRYLSAEADRAIARVVRLNACAAACADLCRQTERAGGDDDAWDAERCAQASAAATVAATKTLAFGQAIARRLPVSRAARQAQIKRIVEWSYK